MDQLNPGLVNPQLSHNTNNKLIGDGAYKILNAPTTIKLSFFYGNKVLIVD